MTLHLDSIPYLQEIAQEWDSACQKFPGFNSGHEGYAVIQEEVDELWDEVKGQYGAERTTKMRKEAIQVAAMALRFIADVCTPPPTEDENG